MNENQKELITVLMSVYNGNEEELKQSINSILNQTYKNFEFIIINDGMSEKLLNTIKSYSDNRIKLFHNDENLGLAKSLNKGIKLAKGKYIARMDADDISYDDRLEVEYKFLSTHSEYSIVGGRVQYFNQNNMIGESKISGEIKKDDLIKGTPFAHPTLMIKKDSLLKIGGYPNYRRAQDYAMEMKMYAHGYKGYILDKVVLSYRDDENNFKRRKFKYRIMEASLRHKYYKEMNVTFLKRIYMLKPIIAGLIPRKIMKNYQEKKFKKNYKI